jgi:hypothetical protein
VLGLICLFVAFVLMFWDTTTLKFYIFTGYSQLGY